MSIWWMSTSCSIHSHKIINCFHCKQTIFYLVFKHSKFLLYHQIALINRRNHSNIFLTKWNCCDLFQCFLMKIICRFSFTFIFGYLWKYQFTILSHLPSLFFNSITIWLNNFIIIIHFFDCTFIYVFRLFMIHIDLI